MASVSEAYLLTPYNCLDAINLIPMIANNIHLLDPIEIVTPVITADQLWTDVIDTL